MAAVQPGPFPSILPAGYHPSPVLGGYIPLPAQQYGLAPQPQPQPPRLQKPRPGEATRRRLCLGLGQNGVVSEANNNASAYRSDIFLVVYR